jgi:hypothetical protein
VNIDRRLVGFGLFLITIGGVMIAVRQGAIDAETARRAWTLWPLILVGAGLSIALAGRPGAPIGGLVLAITFGAIIGGVASSGVFPGVGVCGADRESGTPFAQHGGDLAGAAKVSITQNCGDLVVGTVAGSTWSVSGEARNGIGPVIDSTSNVLRVTAPEGGLVDLAGTSAWDVVLPRDPAIDLSLTLNGGDSRLALDGTHLDRLTVDANAGSIDLDLRGVASLGGAALDINFGSATIRLPERSTTLSLSVNAGSAALCLPPGSGLRVRLDSVAASNDFDGHGLVETNGAWETPGFATAEIRLEVEADVNAGSLSLDPTRSCAG